jgi:hypothetical protein
MSGAVIGKDTRFARSVGVSVRTKHEAAYVGVSGEKVRIGVLIRPFPGVLLAAACFFGHDGSGSLVIGPCGRYVTDWSGDGSDVNYLGGATCANG